MAKSQESVVCIEHVRRRDGEEERLDKRNVFVVRLKIAGAVRHDELSTEGSVLFSAG